MALFLQQARRVARISDKSADRGPTHNIKRLSRSAQLSLFIEALEQDGCVIVSDFTDKATLQQADMEVKPWLESQVEGSKVGGRSASIQNYFVT